MPMVPKPHREPTIFEDLKVQESMMSSRLNNPNIRHAAGIEAPEYLMAAATMEQLGLLVPYQGLERREGESTKDWDKRTDPFKDASVDAVRAYQERTGTDAAKWSTKQFFDFKKSPESRRLKETVESTERWRP